MIRIPLTNPLPMYHYQIDQMMEKLSLGCKSTLQENSLELLGICTYV